MKKDFSNLLGGAIVNQKSEEIKIRDRIVIREDFKALIPPLSVEELEQLEANILKEGVRDPLIIWQVGETFVLVDGHNRFSICKKYGIEFPFKKTEFIDDDDVRDWMIKNQLGRRNLSSMQQSYLRGLRYLREKSQGKRSDLTSGQNVQKSEVESTATRLGKEYNVSDKTIMRDAQFAEGLQILSKENPELEKEVLAGTTKITKQEIQALVEKPKKKLIKKQKPLSVKEIASVAFQYIQTETRTIDAVCKSIGFEELECDPINFFIKWKGMRK